MVPKASSDLGPKDLDQFMKLNSVHHVLLMLLEIKVDGILYSFTMKNQASAQSLALDALIRLASVQFLALNAQIELAFMLSKVLGILIEMASLEFVKNLNQTLDEQVLLNLVFTIYQSNLGLVESLDIYPRVSCLQMFTADMVIETKIIHLYRKSLLMGHRSNMACLIPLVSKTLRDLTNDFQKTLVGQITLVGQKTLVGQHSDMACPIPLVSKILSDLIDDFLMPLSPFKIIKSATGNLDSSLHNFKEHLVAYLVLAIPDFVLHSFEEILKTYLVLKIPSVAYTAFTSDWPEEFHYLISNTLELFQHIHQMLSRASRQRMKISLKT